MKINDYPPELGPPPPVETPAATEKIKENIEILSETIQKLRSELIAEKKKRQFYEQQYKKVIGEKEKLRKEFYKKKMKIKNLTSKTITKKEKLEIVREILGHTKFTKVAHFYSKLVRVH